MATMVRPRRSVLYMPGSNARALEKAKSLAADALILDLEDAVAPDAKAAARAQVRDAARAGGYGSREVIIRTNGLDTMWGGDDLVAAATSGADAVLLPKVESANTVRTALSILDGAGAPEDLAIWCMMETPLGILHAEEVASASPRLGCLVLGTSDLTKDLNARHTAQRLPLLSSLSTCVLAARAFGLAVVDGVYLDLADEAGFEAACRQGLELGFDGKTLIHPRQIEAANRAFGPDQAQVNWARRIIDAFEDAEAEGKAVVVVDGKLVENLHVADAKRLIALHDAIAELEASHD
ncbi:MAG: HpcH/HpaI aldolase/citrate lyase family protein [Sphingomonadales bacterium]